MKIADLIDKGEGKIYVVKKIAPTNVTEIECIAVTKEVAKQRNYFWGWYGWNRDFQFMLARKSKDKKRVRRDGYPTVVYISSTLPYIKVTFQDLDKTRLEINGYIIFLDKDEACDYVIEKVKHRKLELNGIITKVNKFKLSITE